MLQPLQPQIPTGGETDLPLSEGRGSLMGEVALQSGLESLVELGEVDFPGGRMTQTGMHKQRLRAGRKVHVWERGPAHWEWSLTVRL